MAKLSVNSDSLSHLFDALNWDGNVVILLKFSSFAALEFVILTTSGAVIDKNITKLRTFLFQ